MFEHAPIVKPFTLDVNTFTYRLGNLAYMNIGERVKQRRIARGYETQLALAKAIGCKRETVAMWETGKVDQVGGKYLPALCRVLDVSAEWLQTGKADSKPKVTDPSIIEQDIDVLRNVVLAIVGALAARTQGAGSDVLGAIADLPYSDRGYYKEVRETIQDMLKLQGESPVAAVLARHANVRKLR